MPVSALYRDLRTPPIHLPLPVNTLVPATASPPLREVLHILGTGTRPDIQSSVIKAVPVDMIYFLCHAKQKPMHPENAGIYFSCRIPPTGARAIVLLRIPPMTSRKWKIDRVDQHRLALCQRNLDYPIRSFKELVKRLPMSHYALLGVPLIHRAGRWSRYPPFGSYPIPPLRSFCRCLRSLDESTVGTEHQSELVLTRSAASRALSASSAPLLHLPEILQIGACAPQCVAV